MINTARKLAHVDYEHWAALFAVLLVGLGLTTMSVLLPEAWQLAAAAFTAAAIISAAVLYSNARVERAVNQLGEAGGPLNAPYQDGQDDRL